MQTSIQRNNQDFTGQNIYVGLDVHLKSWTVTFASDHNFLKTLSMDPSPEQLHKRLVKHYPGASYHSAYEAGFCGFWIHKELTSLGINSIVVNPGDIPTTHKEKVQKEDARDSKKIATCLRSGKLVPIYVPDEKYLADRDLLRTRATLVKDLSKSKNRVKSFLYSHGNEIPAQHFKSGHWTKNSIQWIKSIQYAESSSKTSLDMLIDHVEGTRARVLEITRAIKKLSQTEEYSRKSQLLRECCPGIGMLTSMLILTDLVDFKRFSSMDKLCSYVGCVPSMHASGEKDASGKIISRKNSRLFSALIESSWVAIRHDAELMRLFNRHTNKGNTNKAIVRVLKKILGRMRYVMINDKPYICSSSSMKHPE